MNVAIRKEKEEDYSIVENLVRESFWNVYRPGCVEHYLLHELRNNPSFVKELDYVMIQDDVIIGQIAFVKAKLNTDSGEEMDVLTMGPVCIANEFKRKGLGRILVDYAISKAKKLGYKAILLEGNYAFYSRCGFKYARKFQIRYHDLPEGADDSFFLCMELEKGSLVSGEYSTPEAYLIDESKVEEFDKNFPSKEKLELPGQLG